MTNSVFFSTFVFCMLVATAAVPARGADSPALASFQKKIEPILSQYCFECHGDGVDKGNVALDEVAADDNIAHNPELWWRVLKNVRSGLMPPAKKEQPTAEQKQALERWIKYDVFGIDPKAPDPG